MRLKTIISAVDPHAFVSVTETNDVMGEGFTLDEQKDHSFKLKDIKRACLHFHSAKHALLFFIYN